MNCGDLPRLAVRPSIYGRPAPRRLPAVPRIDLSRATERTRRQVYDAVATVFCDRGTPVSPTARIRSGSPSTTSPHRPGSPVIAFGGTYTAVPGSNPPTPRALPGIRQIGATQGIGYTPDGCTGPPLRRSRGPSSNPIRSKCAFVVALMRGEDRACNEPMWLGKGYRFESMVAAPHSRGRNERIRS